MPFILNSISDSQEGFTEPAENDVDEAFVPKDSSLVSEVELHAAANGSILVEPEEF